MVTSTLPRPGCQILNTVAVLAVPDVVADGRRIEIVAAKSAVRVFGTGRHGHCIWIDLAVVVDTGGTKRVPIAGQHIGRIRHIDNVIATESVEDEGCLRRSYLE